MSCSVPDCDQLATRRGWCNRHYLRWFRHGDPLAGGAAKSPRGEALAFFEEAVMRETDECVLWPYGTSDKGYGKLLLPGARVSSYVHRLALERRVGPAPESVPYATHGPCHQPACFNYRHLSWGTRSENMLDRVRDGTSSRGTAHGQARLTEELVRDIRRRYAAGEPYRKLASELGVSDSAVYHAIARTSWAWLD